MIPCFCTMALCTFASRLRLGTAWHSLLLHVLCLRIALEGNPDSFHAVEYKICWSCYHCSFQGWFVFSIFHPSSELRLKMRFVAFFKKSSSPGFLFILIPSSEH